LQIFVRDNNVEQALRVLKKKMQREGVFREMRRRRFYEKPSEEAARGHFVPLRCPAEPAWCALGRANRSCISHRLHDGRCRRRLASEGVPNSFC